MTGRPAARTRCPACHGGDLTQFFETRDVPVHCNILSPDAAAAAAAPLGDILLAFCRSCGLIFNQLFDEALTAYSESYENSLYFSPAFQEYADWLADHLVEAFNLHDKDLVEVGCGSAEFLNALCERGDNRGFGFDPSAPPSRFPRVTIVPEFYGPDHAGHPADAVLSRHVLEHVADPAALLTDLRAAVTPGVAFYCEVPNARFVLGDLSVWDIIYEHPSYFAEEPLRFVTSAAGFAVTDSFTGFGDQFLAVEALAGDTPTARTPDPGDLPDLVAEFATAYEEKFRHWEHRLAQWTSTGARIALWGAGSKGVSFLNMVPGADDINMVVDITPRKHGKHIPGSAQPVVGPEDLAAQPPETVLVMNPVYRDEIASILTGLGIDATVEVV